MSLSFPNLEGKVCAKCMQLRPRDEYRKRRRSKDGLTSQCKHCLNSGPKLRSVKLNQILTDGHVQCSKCREMVPVEQMGKDARTTGKLSSQCKKCRSDASKQSYHKRRLLVLAQRQEAYDVFCQSDANSAAHFSNPKPPKIGNLQVFVSHNSQVPPTQNSELATTTPLNTKS